MRNRCSVPGIGDEAVQNVCFFKSGIAKAEVSHFSRLSLVSGVDNLELDKRSIESAKLVAIITISEGSVRKYGNNLHSVRLWRTGHR